MPDLTTSSVPDTEGYYWGTNAEGNLAARFGDELGREVWIGNGWQVTEHRYPDLFTAMTREPEVFGYSMEDMASVVYEAMGPLEKWLPDEEVGR